MYYSRKTERNRCLVRKIEKTCWKFSREVLESRRIPWLSTDENSWYSARPRIEVSRTPLSDSGHRSWPDNSTSRIKPSYDLCFLESEERQRPSILAGERIYYLPNTVFTSFLLRWMIMVISVPDFVSNVVLFRHLSQKQRFVNTKCRIFIYGFQFFRFGSNNLRGQRSGQKIGILPGKGSVVFFCTAPSQWRRTKQTLFVSGLNSKHYSAEKTHRIQKIELEMRFLCGKMTVAIWTLTIENFWRTRNWTNRSVFFSDPPPQKKKRKERKDNCFCSGIDYSETGCRY